MKMTISWSFSFNSLVKFMVIFKVIFLYSKTRVKRPLSKRPKIGFLNQLSLNAGQKYCAILSTFIKLLFVIKIFNLSEWPFYTGCTVILL